MLAAGRERSGARRCLPCSGAKGSDPRWRSGVHARAALFLADRSPFPALCSCPVFCVSGGAGFATGRAVLLRGLRGRLEHTPWCAACGPAGVAGVRLDFGAMGKVPPGRDQDKARLPGCAFRSGHRRGGGDRAGNMEPMPAPGSLGRRPKLRGLPRVTPLWSLAQAARGGCLEFSGPGPGFWVARAVFRSFRGAWRLPGQSRMDRGPGGCL